MQTETSIATRSTDNRGAKGVLAVGGLLHFLLGLGALAAGAPWYDAALPIAVGAGTLYHAWLP